MSKLITPEWCRERDACYTDDELVAVLGSGKTALEVLDLDIPAEHRVWAVIQWLPERELRMFLVDLLSRLFARERAAGREPDERSVAVLTALEAGRWPTREEEAAARAAAWVTLLRRLFAWERAAGREPDPRSVAVLTALEAGRWSTREEEAAAWAAEERAAAWATALARAAAETAEAEAAAAAEHNSQLSCLRRLVEEVQAKEQACQI